MSEIDDYFPKLIDFNEDVDANVSPIGGEFYDTNMLKCRLSLTKEVITPWDLGVSRCFTCTITLSDPCDD